jgi:uncharacterized protein YdhG (YjbR/CyaY superfamily)
VITNKSVPKNIDEYIAGFPDNIQDVLKKIRETIRAAAPDSQEAIKYLMPTFVLNGNLVHFAAFKNHIGFYPAPSGLNAFKDEILKYKNSKGAVQFPLDKGIPYDLITEIVKFRVKENLNKKDNKTKK